MFRGTTNKSLWNHIVPQENYFYTESQVLSLTIKYITFQRKPKKKHCLITFIRLMSTFNQRLMTLIFCVKCEWKRPKCSRKEDLKDKQCIFKRVYLFNSLNNHFFSPMNGFNQDWLRKTYKRGQCIFILGWGVWYPSPKTRQNPILKHISIPFRPKMIFCEVFLYFNLVFFMTIWKWERQRKWRRQKRLKNTIRKTHKLWFSWCIIYSTC